MELNEYQKEAKKTAIYPSPIIYPALGLCGEAGEVAEKVKKVLRDNNGVFTDAKKEEIVKELGDVLWYVANTASDIGFTLEDVAQGNIDKLNSRKERGKISGNGDNR
jgi:NTP pyrophosphatase (non-canonical NTP hydrolase)